MHCNPKPELGSNRWHGAGHWAKGIMPGCLSRGLYPYNKRCFCAGERLNWGIALLFCPEKCWCSRSSALGYAPPVPSFHLHPYISAPLCFQIQRPQSSICSGFSLMYLPTLMKWN